MAWEAEALSYNTVHPRLQMVRDEVLGVNPQNVFELGCSVGKLREELLRYDIDYWGCDLSKAAVELINDKQVVPCDLNHESLPFDGPFECIAGSGILEYVEDLPGLLDGVRVRLVPGGYLVVSYYNMTHVLRRTMSLLGRPLKRHPDWKTSFSPRQIAQMMEEAGFDLKNEQSVAMRLSNDFRKDSHRGRRLPGRRLHANEIVYTARLRADTNIA